MYEKNKENVRKLFELAWNKGNFELLQTFNAPNAKIFDPYLEVDRTGFEGAKYYMETYRQVFPDLFFKIDDIIAENEKVVAFLNVTGTHQGEFLGLAPTNVKTTLPCVVKFTFDKDGKILESRTLWDAFSFMKAAGRFEMPKKEYAAR